MKSDNRSKVMKVDDRSKVMTVDDRSKVMKRHTFQIERVIVRKARAASSCPYTLYMRIVFIGDSSIA